MIRSKRRQPVSEEKEIFQAGGGYFLYWLWSLKAYPELKDSLTIVYKIKLKRSEEWDLVEIIIFF